MQDFYNLATLMKQNSNININLFFLENYSQKYKKKDKTQNEFDHRSMSGNFEKVDDLKK